MTLIPEQYIRAFAKQRKLNFSKHSLDKMKERRIRDHQVYDCVCNGEMVEKQEHGRDVKIVFQEATDNQAGFYVVVAASYPLPEVVTVCLTWEEVWENLGTIMKRRKRDR